MSGIPGCSGGLGRRWLVAVGRSRPRLQDATPRSAQTQNFVEAAERPLQIGADIVFASHNSKYDVNAGRGSGQAGAKQAIEADRLRPQPSRQAVVDLQRLQTRSPGQPLSKRSRHIKQRRFFTFGGSLGRGLLRVACFMTV